MIYCIKNKTELLIRIEVMGDYTSYKNTYHGSIIDQNNVPSFLRFSNSSLALSVIVRLLPSLFAKIFLLARFLMASYSEYREAV